MTGNRVLVTGGAGFIGSKLATRLAEDNDVIAVNDCYFGDPDSLADDMKFVETSVLETDYRL